MRVLTRPLIVALMPSASAVAAGCSGDIAAGPPTEVDGAQWT